MSRPFHVRRIGIWPVHWCSPRAGGLDASDLGVESHRVCATAGCALPAVVRASLRVGAFVPASVAGGFAAFARGWFAFDAWRWSGAAAAGLAVVPVPFASGFDLGVESHRVCATAGCALPAVVRASLRVGAPPIGAPEVYSAVPAPAPAAWAWSFVVRWSAPQVLLEHLAP